LRRLIRISILIRLRHGKRVSSKRLKLMIGFVRIVHRLIEWILRIELVAIAKNAIKGIKLF
jgi:hypothetical protein